MRYVKPSRYPHRGRYIYTRRGFRTRLRPRLLAEGWRPREADKLERLYFGIDLTGYLDDVGMYRNVRSCRLYYMARGLSVDRKNPIFELVVRSRMFYCYFDEDGRVMGFSSPYLMAVNGTLII